MFRAFRVAFISACFVTTVVAQDRTALYGRVLGSDHDKGVPDGWVVRVTAVREGTTDVLDKRDSVSDLYCVRVPSNSRVRLLFETSFRPKNEALGYGSARLKEIIDTSASDRKETYRPQPDVIMPRRRPNTGVTAGLVTKQELDSDISIARETGNMSMLGARIVTYREAYGSNASIMADLDRAAANLGGEDYTPRKPAPKPVPYEDLLKGFENIETVRKHQPDLPSDDQLLRLWNDESLFSDLRSQAALALVEFYSSDANLEGTDAQSAALAGSKFKKKVPRYSRVAFLSQLRRQVQFESSSRPLRLASYIGLAKIGTIADRQEIVKSVNSADSERAHAAIVAIGEARMPEGVAPLATFLKSDAPPTLRKAATLSLESLAEARVAGAFATLRTLIASDEPPVRIEAAETLGRLKSIYAEASEILKEIQTKDPSPEVRVAAKLALEPRP